MPVLFIWNQQGALFGRFWIIDYLCTQIQISMKNKDVFSKVEKEAREKLKNPDTKGAAQTVLEYIERQRKGINNL